MVAYLLSPSTKKCAFFAMNSTIWVYLAVYMWKIPYNGGTLCGMCEQESYLGDTVVDDRLVDGVDEVFQGKHLVRQHLCLGGHALQSVQRVLAHLAHLDKRLQSSLGKNDVF